jgi:hypothetical protein
MHCYAPAALVVAFGLTAFAPPTLHAQYKTAATVGATTRRSIEAAPRSIPAHLPLGPVLPARRDSTRRADSLGRDLLVGAGVGAAVGLTLGIVSRNHSSECDACVPPTEARRRRRRYGRHARWGGRLHRPGGRSAQTHWRWRRPGADALAA